VDEEAIRERLHCEINELQRMTENILLAARLNSARSLVALESIAS